MLVRLLVRNLIWFAGLGALLFLAAGTMRWPSAWVFLFEVCAMSLLRHLWLSRHDPGLFKERMKIPVQRAQPSADRWLMIAFLLLSIAWLLLMGVERRYLGASRFPVLLQVLGAAGILVGFQLALLTLQANSFASPAVKVQEERGQTIIRKGPYSIVRHPLYAAAVVVILSTPLLLGSLWGLLLAPVFGVLLGARAVLEERVLRSAFVDYGDYSTEVRYRIIPLLW